MTWEVFLVKISSRKFWLCLAAFLASVATSVTAYGIESEFLMGLGLACAVLSAAIYAACEAAVDASKKDA